MRIFSRTIMNYLKKLVGTKSLNIKQCPAGFSSKIISLYSPSHQKFPLPLMLLFCSYQAPTVPPSLETLCRTLRMGRESHQTAKNLLISPTREISLTKFTSSPVKSVILSPSKSNFYIMTQFASSKLGIIDVFNFFLKLNKFTLYYITTFIVAVIIAVVSFFFNFMVYLYICLANFD